MKVDIYKKIKEEFDKSAQFFTNGFTEYMKGDCEKFMSKKEKIEIQ